MMNKYTAKISITGPDIAIEVKTTIVFKAATKEDLFEQIKGFKVFNAKVEQEDFEFVSNMVKERPKIIPAIKSLVEDLENKSLLQISALTPKYISKFKEILK